MIKSRKLKSHDRVKFNFPLFVATLKFPIEFSMTRTKQTARKSTGGEPPRAQLKNKERRAMTVPKRSAGGPAPRGNLALNCHPDQDMDVDPEQPNSPASSPLPPPPDSPVVASKATNTFCALCQDGGDTMCLLIPKRFGKIVHRPNVDFLCPSCHELKDRNRHAKHGRRTYTPYWGFTRSNQPVLDSFPVLTSNHTLSAQSEVNSEPLLILHFFCKGMESRASPADLVNNLMQPYFSASTLQFLEVEFDFGTTEKVHEHAEKMEALRKEIRAVPAGRALIFISTHSEEQRGDLFAGHEGPESKPSPIAIEVDKFFMFLLAGGLASHVKGATIVLMTCGWLVKHEPAFKSLQRSLKELQASYCVAFTALHFQTTIASIFLQALAFQTFVENFALPKSISTALENSFRMGQHSDVILLTLSPPTASTPSKMLCEKYVWWNMNSKPYGTSLPLACVVCGAVRPWNEAVWTGYRGKSSWSVSCGNEHCGLQENGVRVHPHGTVVGSRPVNMRYITPRRKRQHGWVAVTMFKEDF
ncbi:hypothetical protein BU15DRAFT_69437 [Melanogaster broomeanus]|nr:hypothetical protein BU15DRAFT_69437 [Melanogaster broomeanus]